MLVVKSGSEHQYVLREVNAFGDFWINKYMSFRKSLILVGPGSGTYMLVVKSFRTLANPKGMRPEGS